MHRPTAKDEHYVHASQLHGLGFGGEVGGAGFALRLSPDFVCGSCMPSHTYEDTSRMASSRDFLVQSVQLWDVAPDEAVRSLTSSKAAWTGGAGPASVLTPGPNKLMLEFVGMEKEVAMLRRYSG